MKDLKGNFHPKSSVILSLSKDQFSNFRKISHFPPIVFALVLLLVGLGTAQAASDEIDAFIKGFDSMSLNGVWPGVDLPEDTPLEKVVEAFAKTQKRTTDSGQYEGYRIVEIKKIRQQSNSELSGYTAVLISSSRGSKTILLIRNMGRGWSIRPYFITTVP